MKRKHILILVIFFVSIILGCKKQQEKSLSKSMVPISVQEIDVANNVPPARKEKAKWEEIKRRDGTIILKTSLKDRTVKAKCQPSNDSDDANLNLAYVISIYVLGNYVEKDEMENKLWLFCTAGDVSNYGFGYSGGFWLLPEMLFLPDDYRQSEINFSKIMQKSDEKLEIEIELRRCDEISYNKVITKSLNNHKIRSFNWNDCESGFSYYDSVGTYLWDTETNAIYPVTYIGDGEGCFENIITNDKKYLFSIKDFARADKFESIEITDLSDNTSRGVWNFYKSFDYNVDSIIIGDEYWPKVKKVDGSTNEKSLEYAQEFELSYIKSDEETSWGEDATIYVKYRLNLSDFSTEFIGCEYVRGYFGF